MDLEDLKQRWQEQDRKLDEILNLNTRLLQLPVLNRAHTALRWLSLGLWIELALTFGAVFLLGSFLADHFAEPRFLAPALLLDLAAILLLAAGIRQLAALGAIDYSAPIVAIQQRLESLRAERIRATQWTLLASPLLWTPFLIVAFRGLFGLDAYAIFPGDWLFGNLLFGILVIPLAVGISRRYADRMARSPRVQRLMRTLAGHSLAAATGFLDSLAEFAKEGQA